MLFQAAGGLTIFQSLRQNNLSSHKFRGVSLCVFFTASVYLSLGFPLVCKCVVLFCIGISVRVSSSVDNILSVAVSTSFVS
jgi:hypothetical protein